MSLRQYNGARASTGTSDTIEGTRDWTHVRYMKQVITSQGTRGWPKAYCIGPGQRKRKQNKRNWAGSRTNKASCRLGRLYHIPR